MRQNYPYSRHAARLFCFGFCLAAASAFGQQPTPPQPPSTPTVAALPIAIGTDPNEKPFRTDFTIGLTVVGTHALPGLDVAFRLSRKFDARLGFNYFDHTIHVKNVTIGHSSQAYNIDVQPHQSSISLFLGWNLARNGKVRLNVGAAYFLKNSYYTHFETATNSVVNDVELTPGEVGDGEANIVYTSKISPYLGFTFGRVIPNRRWAFCFDLGAFYKGTSNTVDINGTGLLTENDRNEKPLSENLKKQTFLWPVLAFRVAYKLSNPPAHATDVKF